MFYYLLKEFKNTFLFFVLEASNVFVSCLTDLELRSRKLFNTKPLLHTQQFLAYSSLFWFSRNTICFIIITSNFNNCKNEINLIHLLSHFLLVRMAVSSFCSCGKPIFSDTAVNRFVTFYIIINGNPSDRVLTRTEINIALIASGIESNPGPDTNPIPKLKIVTINCNGLTCNLRLLQTISKIKKCLKKQDCIVFLQETHNANIVLLESVWEGSVHVSPGTGGSRGVITLCSRNLITLSFKTDEEGRYLFTTIKLPDDRLINTANLYSPNDHNVSYHFISKVFSEWNAYCSNSLTFTTTPSFTSSIIAGDFNCVLKSQDSQQRTWSTKEQRLADHITASIENQEMYDSTLRSQNGNNFTWSRGNIFSKIDHIFVSHDLLTSITEYNTIWDFVKSDHAAIQLSISLDCKNSRGRSYPKLNLIDLKGDGVVNEIRTEINKAIQDFPSHWDPHLKLDFIKLVIRTKILEIRAASKKNKDSIQLLRDKVNYFCTLTTLSSQQALDFSIARTELYRAEEYEAERLRLAAGVKWREQGERSNKFFLNSLKINQASSTLDFLNTPDGKVDNMNDILNYAKNFYTNLYNKHPTKSIDDFYKNCPSLSASAQLELSRPLTINDLKKALKSCKDSTPGLDGIPYSYYKIFGNELLPLVLASWEFSNVTGLLPPSQSTSVISLIPKSGKDKHEIKNWRPISISSCDLKIITKAYSQKVGTFLGDIISDSQMGYVPGRDINFNNRILNTALELCKSSNLDYSIMSLDAQKAYDSVDHEYIANTLKAYGFPDEFIAVVNILHHNLKAQVQVNGFLSSSFSIQRGVKQGDALSCALFIIAVDPLIRNIENNQYIPALTLSENCAIKTLAYADDIAIVSTNNNDSFNTIFDEYGKLSNMSGLTLNADKTEILNLSHSAKHTTLATYLNNDLTLNHKPEITICGNCLSLDPSICYNANISNKIAKLSKQLNLWKGRHLTINGKMIIIKTFAISQLIYSSQFQVINPKDVRKIEHLCYNFLWNGPDRVKRVYLKSGRDEGGINGIDIESFFNSIAVRQFFKSYNNSTLAIVNNCPSIKEVIKTKARAIIRKLLLHHINSPTPVDTDDNQWMSQIRADFLVKPYSKTHHLMLKLDINTVSSINSIHCPRTELSQIRKALPSRIVGVIDNPNTYTNADCIFCFPFNNVIKEITKATSKEINNAIKDVLHKKTEYHPSNKYPIDKSSFGDIRMTWHNLWRIKNPTLRAIRLKILYKDVWCQDKRLKLGIGTDNKCTICGEPETVMHQLFFCNNAKRLWDIGRKILGAGELSLVEQDSSTIANLIEVSPSIINEIIKSVIFKLLIQIDRSSNLNELDTRRIIAHWMSIEYQALSKTFKNNNLQLANLQRILSKLRG